MQEKQKTGAKHCGGCETTKPLSEFYRRGGKRGNQPQSRCKECQHKGWQERNARRAYHLRKIGWTKERYDEYLEIQDEKCAICGEEDTDRGLAADHDHYSGKPRELLCKRCNMGLGHFDDDPWRVAEALDYLLEHTKAML